MTEEREVPGEIIEALKLFDQYVEGGSKDNNLLAQCVEEMAKLEKIKGFRHHHTDLIKLLRGKPGDYTTASLGVWFITVKGTWGQYPADIKKKILEMRDAIEEAY